MQRLMKKNLGGLCAMAVASAKLAGCAKNADCCAGGGDACKAKEAQGGTCCNKCSGPDSQLRTYE